MTRFSPAAALVLCMVLIVKSLVMSQSCDSPLLVCPSSAGQSLDTGDGSALNLPSAFCFDEASNAVYLEFTTLDINQFPNVEYVDSTATLSINGLQCNPDTNFGQGVNVAVFSATDLCDFSTFDSPAFCESNLITGQQIALTSLQPGTTYHVLVSGSFGDPPLSDPGDCSFQVSVSGPAVSYELNADFVIEGNEDRTPKIVFVGESVLLSADDALDGYTWSGDFLSSAQGNSVTVTPEGIDQAFTYNVETQINGCLFTDEVTFTIRAAITPFSAFTPNADGFNDLWEIKNISQWPNAQINVFSRWGQKVFQATNYQNNWNGDDLPEATYYYVIELNPVDFNSEPYTGSVTIVR